jgi:hypothetical protein
MGQNVHGPIVVHYNKKEKCDVLSMFLYLEVHSLCKVNLNVEDLFIPFHVEFWNENVSGSDRLVTASQTGTDIFQTGIYSYLLKS